MKIITYFRFFLCVVLFSLLSTSEVRGDKLCQSSYTGTIGALGSKTVYVSVGTIGTNMYRIVFESDFAMTGSLTYVNTSYNNNLCLDNATKTILDGGKIIYFDVPSTSAPTFKNGIQVSYGGGGYTLSGTAVNSVDWSQTRAECATLAGECTYTTNELILKVTTDGMTSTFELSHSSSDIIAVNNVNPVNLNGGSTSDLTNSGWTISDGKATKSITWSTLPTNNIITRVDIYANITGPSEKGGTFNSVDISCASSEEESSSEGNFDCSGHTFYFANNQWIFASPYAHMYNASGSPTTTWPGSAMSEVSGAAGIYSVTYDNDAYNKVIFSNNGSNQLVTKDIDDCTYYDYQGTSHENLSDVARHIYFVRNGNASSWNPPHARLYYGGSNNGDAGRATTSTGLTNIDEDDLFSIIVPIYNNVGFKNKDNYTNASVYTYIDNTFQDYSIFNYEHGNWYQTQNIYLTGSMNSWATSNSNYKFSDWDQASTYVTLLTPALSASTTYDFKVITGGVTRGLNSDNTYNANNQTKRLYEGGASEANVHLTTDVAGKYLFRYDVSACKLTIFFPPSMTSATLYSKTHNSAVISVASTRGTKYKVVDETNGIDQTLTPSTGKITVTGLTPGTQYTFTVTALDDNDTESANNVEMDAFYTLPVMGTATFNTRTYNSITLEVTGTGASQYRVVNTSPAIDQTITPSDGKITITSLSPNTSYTFTVTAKNAGGDASANSVVMSAIYTTPQMTTATLDSKTQTTVVLNVASNGGATYKVTNTSGDEYTLSSSTPTDGKITVTGLTQFTTYTFRVYAISSSSSLESSNYIDVSNVRTFSAGPATAPSTLPYPTCQVYGIYGTQYTNKGMTHGAWEAASSAESVTVDSKSMIHVNTHQASYFGMEYGTKSTDVVDASAYGKFHLEIWTPAAYTFKLCLINGDGAETTKTSITTNAGSWTSYDYDLSSWTTTYQIKFDNITTGEDVEMWFAQAYFYKTSAPCAVNANREDLDECRVLSIIGTTKYDTVGISSHQGWSSESGQRLTVDTKIANNVWRIYNGTASALHLRNESNVQFFNKMHIEVWSATERNIQFGLLCYSDADSRYNENEGGTAYQKQTISTRAAQWTSVDYTLTDLTTAAYLAKVTHLYFYNLESKDLYVTNVYFYNDDDTKPVVVSATNSGVSGTDLTLTLTATYKEAALKDFRITNTTTGDVYDRTANGSNQVTIPDIQYCESYDLDIQAIYNNCILSDATGMTVSGNAMSSGTALIATNATISADATAFSAADAIDGNTTTRWASGSSETNVPHYILVDLGSIRNVASMKIGWEYSNPNDYYIEGSVDGTNYYPLKHETTVPPNGSAEGSAFNDYDTYTFAAAVGVQYLKVRSVTNKSGYGMSIWEMQAYGQCYSASDNPVTTYAQVASQVANITNTAVNVTLDLGAYDYETTFGNMRWKISYAEAGESATVLDNQTASSGQFALNGLKFSTTYSVSVWARDGVDGNLGNAINFNFTTPDKQPTLYFRSALNWQDGGLNTDYRFAYVSEGSDVMSFTTPTLVTNALEYRPYNDANNNLAVDDAEIEGGGFCTPGNQFINGQSGNTVTFYAKDKDHFVSDADLLYVMGSAVYASDASIALPMKRSGATYYWEGPVRAGNYRVIVKAQESNSLASAVFTDHSKARIMDLTAWANSSGWTKAKLTFDLETWTCTWEESDVDVCTHTGSAGSGITLNGASRFAGSEAYEIKTYTSGDYWIVRTVVSNVTDMNAILQPFTNAAATSVQEIFKSGKSGDTVVFVVNPSTITYTLNNITHYTIKVEGAAALHRQTDIHYYDFSGDGECAPDYFDIYHYDDAPVGARTSYAGGTILQPIRYFRHFEHTDWCAITFPFTVSRVAVYDNTDEAEYDLYPRFNNGSSDVEGYYWLKTFDNWNSTPVAISEFQSAWKQLTVSTAESDDAVLAGLVKPAKDVPYVIAFPDGGTAYYETNWVIFYGNAGQTIDSEEDSGCGTSFSGDGETVKLQRNNMMKPTSSKTNIYMLEEGYDFYSKRTQAIPAFESYVIGTSTVQARYAIIRYRGEEPQTPTAIENIPTTEGWQGEIYALSGMRVASFANRDQMENCLNSLATGVYVVRVGAQINKVIVH